MVAWGLCREHLETNRRNTPRKHAPHINACCEILKMLGTAQIASNPKPPRTDIPRKALRPKTPPSLSTTTHQNPGTPPPLRNIYMPPKGSCSCFHPSPTIKSAAKLTLKHLTMQEPPPPRSLGGQQTPSKKGRGRPKKGAAKPSKKRSAPASTSSESEPECEPESESSSQLTPVQPRKMPNKAKNTNKKKKKRRTSGGGGGDDDSVKLRGNDTDLGKRIAKEFSEGVFTGEVVEVKPTGARGILWKIE